MNALILVDIQNDFCPGGALAVPDGDAVVAVANQLIERGGFDLVIATQDFHPAGHASFASQHAGRSIGDLVDLDGIPQVMWPDHCVRGTHGAGFAPGIDLAKVDTVFPKGENPRIDSYSGFFDNATAESGLRNATGLDAYLTEQGVDEVTICGLATDYCVKYTALDAAGLGLKTTVVIDGCRGVELNDGDVEKAKAEMLAASIRLVDSKDIIK